MESTYQKVVIFRQNARQYVAESGTKNNHLIYALARVLDKTEKIEREYRRKSEDTRSDHALIKDGCFVRDKANQIEIDPLKAKSFTKAMDELSGEIVDFDPYIAKTIPKDLPIAYYQVFVPFVIEDFPEPEDSKE